MQGKYYEDFDVKAKEKEKEKEMKKEKEKKNCATTFVFYYYFFLFIYSFIYLFIFRGILRSHYQQYIYIFICHIIFDYCTKNYKVWVAIVNIE